MKTYKQTIAGIDHTFQLSDEDAKARGLGAGDVVDQDATVATSPLDFDKPSTDGQDVEDNVKADAEAKQAAAPSNKARRAATADDTSK